MVKGFESFFFLKKTKPLQEGLTLDKKDFFNVLYYTKKHIEYNTKIKPLQEGLNHKKKSLNAFENALTHIEYNTKIKPLQEGLFNNMKNKLLHLSFPNNSITKNEAPARGASNNHNNNV